MFKIILSIGVIQGAAVFIQLVKSKIIAVYLGPAGVGVIGTIDQFVQFAGFVCSLGITDASIKFLARSHSAGHREFERTYAFFFKLLLLLTIGGTALSVCLGFWHPDISGKDLAKYSLYLILALSMLPALMLGLFLSRVLAAAQQYRKSSFLVVITNAVTTVAITAGLLAAGMLGFYLGGIFANTLLIIGTILYLHKKLDLSLFNRETRLLEEIRRSPEILSFTATFYFVAVVNSFSFLVARYTVLTNFGEVEAGLLHGVFALSLSIGLILNPAIKLYFTPIINRNIEKKIKITHTLEFQKKMIIFLGLCSLAVVLFPGFLMMIMFSEEFVGAGGMVFLFVISQFIFQIAFINLTLLIGIDDLKAYAGIYIAGQLFFAVLCIFLVPLCGTKGVAFGHIISGTMLYFLTLARLIKEHGFAMPLKICAFLAYILSVLCFAGLVSNRISEVDVLSGILKVGFFVLFSGSLFFFLDAAERKYLYTLRVRIFQKKTNS